MNDKVSKVPNHTVGSNSHSEQNELRFHSWNTGDCEKVCKELLNTPRDYQHRSQCASVIFSHSILLSKTKNTALDRKSCNIYI